MNEFTYLIVGGGVAGTSAAEAIRQHDRTGSIAIVSDEPHRLYSRILLSKPNLFLGKFPLERVWLKTEAWYAENTVTLIARKKAVHLNPHEKILDLQDGTQLRYGRLLLAIGERARTWGVSGANKRGVYYLRTLDDAKAIMEAVKTAKRGVAIGGGFISFEMCEMMRLAGLEVTLLIREPSYWAGFLDETSGKMIEKALKRGGVKIFKETEAQSIAGEEKVEKLVLKDGTEIPCDMVIAGIGVMCPFAWISQAGVAVNRGILANERLETNIEGVWTAGDAAEFFDVILGEQIQLGNWVNAQMQGRRAGLNMVGQHEPFRLVSSYTTQGFGITIAFVGDVQPLPDRQVIVRETPESGSYSRILVKDHEIIGATLINRTEDLGALSKLIERDVNVSARETELANPSVELTSLLP